MQVYMSAQMIADLTLDGYRLIRFLGRGGFGEVWLCRSEAMGDYRALKWIPATNSDRLEKEYESLLHYRKAAAGLRSPHLVAIEHVNRNAEGLYYVMPLADGYTANDPSDPEWQPLCLAAKIHARTAEPRWFSSGEIITLIQPILEGLQTLSDAGLVHRDVKPENILFFNGTPCLGDISLLGEDVATITRRGTPGYATPSWYRGGHPDMYGAAATLYTLLTGNPPDRMGKSTFLLPPNGEHLLTASERAEWKRLHAVIRRATEEKIAERYVDFTAMAKAITNLKPAKPRLPRLLAFSLVFAGIAAAIWLAAFRGKFDERTTNTHQQPAQEEPAVSGPESDAADLSPEQRADYMALAGMIQGYIGDGQYGNALAAVEELLATYPQARTQPAYSIARAIALQKLGRIEDAKAELRKDIHLSPQITPMSTRKDLWEELGDLGAAEEDLTRILKKFGPNTLVLFLRADVRAKRGNFAGVHEDRMQAREIKPDDPEQGRLVETMWSPLETKFPPYADYLKSLRVSDGDGAPSSSSTHDDSWVLEVFDGILSDLTKPDIPLSDSALRGRALLGTQIRESFTTGDYGRCLALLNRMGDSSPVLLDTPVLSLLRALLLQRLGRHEEADRELSKSCHKHEEPRLIEERTTLLEALGKRREAAELLTRMIGGIEPADDELGSQSLPLLALRARILAALGDYSGVENDRAMALAKIPVEPPREGLDLSLTRYAGDRKRQWIDDTWGKLGKRFPGYAAYLKSRPEK
jgi:serine/threonine protein kinase